MTFDAAVQEFATYLRIECGLAENSLVAYSGDLADLKRFLAGQDVTDLQQVSLGHIQAWLRNLADRSFATSSISRKLAAVRMFWKYLFSNGRVTSDLVHLLESPKLWHRLPRIVDTSQVSALLEAPDEEDQLFQRDRAILELFYASGLRVSELARLKLGDVNLQVGFVRCIGKGRKERIVPVGGPAGQALQEYLDHLRPRLVRAGGTAQKRRRGQRSEVRGQLTADSHDSGRAAESQPGAAVPQQQSSPGAAMPRHGHSNTGGRAASGALGGPAASGTRAEAVAAIIQDRIFVSRTGRPLDRHNIYRLVQRYARRAGISVKMTPHSLRHCFASHLLAGGADLRIVQELLGHASVVTTQIYTHVDHARLKRIHERFHPMG